MHSAKMLSIMAVTGLLMTPALPVYDFSTGGAAHAKSEKSESKGGKSESAGKSDSGGGKSAKSSSKKSEQSKKSSKSKKADQTTKAAAKVKAEDGLRPNELGKMNGALNANINAVLAHIRNGQTSNGPIGLLAGLAIADAGAAAPTAEADALVELAAGFTALEGALSEQGFATVEEYLAAKADGTAGLEQIAMIDPLIETVGGLDGDGTALAQTAPTAEEIAAAQEAAAGAEGGVADAEAAILAAWNKEGDSVALLAALREKLAAHQDKIQLAIQPAPEELPVTE